jgi:hypothetical protein
VRELIGSVEVDEAWMLGPRKVDAPGGTS